MKFRRSLSGDQPFRLLVPEELAVLFRFHSPLIKPDVRFSRIRLSDKVIHAVAREIARAALKLEQAQLFVQVGRRITNGVNTPTPVFTVQPLA